MRTREPGQRYGRTQVLRTNEDSGTEDARTRGLRSQRDEGLRHSGTHKRDAGNHNGMQDS